MKILLITFFWILVVGCSKSDRQEGKDISLNPAEITSQCQEIGIVNGSAGSFLGGSISEKNLEVYALSDMKKNAAKVGATHVLHNGDGLRNGIWTSTQGNVSGKAYKCPQK